jgi:hypothetical protein
MDSSYIKLPVLVEHAYQADAPDARNAKQKSAWQDDFVPSHCCSPPICGVVPTKESTLTTQDPSLVPSSVAGSGQHEGDTPWLLWM